MLQSPLTAVLDIKRLARYLLIISLSSEHVPPKNYPDVKVPAHLYLFDEGCISSPGGSLIVLVVVVRLM